MHEKPDPILHDLIEATRRFNRLVMLKRHSFAQLGLRPYEWHFLGHLGRADQGEGVKPSDLAATLSVTPGNITQIITSLESRGLITRKSDTRDRRVIRVSLTDSGRLHMEAMRASITADYAGLVETLGGEACLTLVNLLNQVSEYFETRTTPDHNFSPEKPQ